MRFENKIRFLLAAAAFVVAMLALGGPLQAQVAFEFRVNFAPPELPVYEQPICPGDGYIWTPGYWAWDDEDADYYWVPGTWVLAPEPGYLWTPGYWGWYDNAYVFYPGYWGPQVGFYGGIDYGFGYFGHGYEGGRWEGGHFYYNRAVNRIDQREIRNVYDTPVRDRDERRVSFNGGRGGIEARASAAEERAARERHVGRVEAQQQQLNAARGDRSLRASENHGRPPIAATSRAGSFSGGGVEAARSGGNYNPPPNRGANARGNQPGATNRPETRTDRPPSARNENGGNRATYVHPNELPKRNRPEPPPSSGNPKADQKYQQQQEKLYQKQQQEHQKLQQKQDQEHQRASQRQENQAQKQQMEQRHQQQTQQMEQRHTQQREQEQRRAPQPRPQPKQQPPHGEGQPHH